MTDQMNLLPWGFRLRLLAYTRLRQWLIVWGVAVAVLAAYGTVQTSRLHSQRARSQVLDAQCQPLRAMAAENKVISQRVAEISGRQSLLTTLDAAQYPLRLVGIVSQSTAATESRLFVEELGLTRSFVAAAPTVKPPAGETSSAPSAAPAAQPPPSVERLRLTLTGIAADDLAVARFIAALRDAQVFDSVELKSSIGTDWKQGLARKYEVECTF
jgi:Tfp pilus assembly protein PilN